MQRKTKPKHMKTPFREKARMAMQPPPGETHRRDKSTNVYIPDDTEVAEAKAWGEFCKL